MIQSLWNQAMPVRVTLWHLVHERLFFGTAAVLLQSLIAVLCSLPGTSNVELGTILHAQEPSLPVIWRAQLPDCCFNIAASPDDQYVYYINGKTIGKVRASDGVFMASVLVPDDSVINVDEAFGFFHLKTRSQLVVVGNGIPRMDDRSRGIIQIYDVPEMRHVRSILIPKWWDYGNEGFISGPSCISADERYIVITGIHEGTINRVYVYDLISGDLVWMHEGTDQQGLMAAFTRDSLRLVISTTIYPQGPSYVSCWDPIAQTMFWEKRITSKFGAQFQFTEDGKRIVVQNSEYLGVFTYPELANVYQSDISTGRVLPSDDGSQLLMQAIGIKILDVQSKNVQVIDPLGWILGRTTDWKSLYFGTGPALRKMFKVRFDWTVDVREEPGIKSVSLSPNPCITDGGINVWLPTPQHISVGIYDSAGRIIINVFDGMLDAGEHTLRFNCTALPVGVCFVYTRIGTNFKSFPLMVGKDGIVK